MSQEVQRDEYYTETPGVPVAGEPVLRTVPMAPPVAQVREVVMTPAPVAPVREVVMAPAPVREVVMAPAPITDVRTASTRRFAPDAVVAAGVGVALLLFGLIAITRGGFKGPMETPVVQVLGFAHTTTLGIIEIIFGVALLIAGATASRAGARFFGSVLAIGAFVGAVQAKSFHKSLALESSFAWLLVLAGALVVFTSLLLPRYLTRSSSVVTSAR